MSLLRQTLLCKVSFIMSPFLESARCCMEYSFAHGLLKTYSLAQQIVMTDKSLRIFTVFRPFRKIAKGDH